MYFGIGPVKQKFEHKIVNISLPSNLNISAGHSKEHSHRDSSFEYPQHMFWLRNMKNNFQFFTLIWGPVMASENCIFILVIGTDPDVELHSAAFHLCLHCSLK